jgi:glutamate-1-semialdehyde 2,1-aminomutase
MAGFDGSVRGNSVDAALRARALAVVPGGMWGHQRAANLSDAHPQFFARAQGSHIWDVDGNEYVDLMCGWGPILLGYNHPEVEAAARAQAARGDAMNGPGEAMVELAELLVSTIPHAAWVQFQKNGTDATTACVTIARAASGRRKVLVANGAYHGAAPWCTPVALGVTSEDRAHLLRFDYNDAASLDRAVEAAGDDLAAIVVSAFRHDIARDQEMPTPDFARHVRALCDATGAALILDDVRAGFRLHEGGSWELVGVRPDLSAWSKAIANGHSLAAVTGVERFREAASGVYATGSFWTAAVPMAASVATLRVLHRDGVVAHIVELGEMLRAGLRARAERHGFRLRQTGPVQMPMVLFDDDPEQARGRAFCAAALRHGAYLHPRHNMFLSGAHTREDISAVLEAAEKAFEEIAGG